MARFHPNSLIATNGPMRPCRKSLLEDVWNERVNRPWTRARPGVATLKINANCRLKAATIRP